jgi:hypothetical protein
MRGSNKSVGGHDDGGNTSTSAGDGPSTNGLCQTADIVVGGRGEPRTCNTGPRYDCFQADLAPASRWPAGKMPTLRLLVRGSDVGQLDALPKDFLLPAGSISDFLS